MANDDKEQTIRLFIESPEGKRFKYDVFITTTLRQIAMDFFEYMKWPNVDSQGRGQRAVIELVDLENQGLTKRLHGDQTVEDAGLWDGAILLISYESIAGGALAPGKHTMSIDLGAIQVGRNVSGGVATGSKYVTDGQVGCIGDNSHITGGILFTNRRLKNSIVRYSDISCPSHIQVHNLMALRIAITLKPISENAVPLDLQVPPDFTTLEVDVCLIASPVDFDLQGPNIQTVEVPKDADSAPVIFKVVPKTLGRKTVAVEFFQAARYLGRAEVETTVEKETRTAETICTSPILALSTQQLSPDLTIYIEEVSLDKTRRLYRFLLLSPLRDLNLHFEEAGEIEVKGEPAAYFAGIFAELNAWLRQRNVNKAEFYGRLNSLGASLYEQLFPDKLKRLYWEKLRDKVKSVQIISADPWIPWELVRPYHPETLEEDDFLCERFDLTRWLAGPASPDTFNFQRMALIVDAPKQSAREKEATDLKQFPGILAEDIPPTLQAIYTLLESCGFNVLHFACHGEYESENPDQSPLWLEGRQPLRPNDIVGKKRAFGREKPLVFLNACETGQSGVALTGIGGWARAFVKAGAAGFLGSLWEAQDESAYRFALAFYGYLLDGRTIAEAVRLARKDIRKAGDPTWLSYTVYAHPLARVENMKQEATQ